jgi:hypothetical protein
MHDSSEVAQLLRRIDEECQAAQRALTGLSCGTARHDFINRRTQNIQRVHERLVELVGPGEAIELVVNAIDAPHNRCRYEND